MGAVTDISPPPDLAEQVARHAAAVTEEARQAVAEATAAGRVIWDPFDPRWRSDPFAVYDELRATNPVHRSPLGFWVFARHADCLAMLRDRRSSSDARTVAPDAFQAARAGDLVAQGPAADILEEMAPFLFRDPPDHTRLRGLVQKAFTPRSVEALRPRVEAVCDELLDAAFEAGSADLVSGFAQPLPVRIIAEMLGVPEEDHAQFTAWSDALARGLDPDFLLPPDAVQQRLSGILNFVQYFAQLIAERREHPGDDLISRLIAAEASGDVLSQGELISTCILLLVAGHETTVNLISGGILALLENPDQLRLVRDDPALARPATEEMLRYVSPVQLTGRAAREDIEVGGVTVRSGEFAMLLIGSANRDETVFSHPQRFDVHRDAQAHLGFGFGIHHCLGAPLARLETQVAVPALVRRARRIELDGDTSSYKDNIVLRGLAELPVRLSA